MDIQEIRCSIAATCRRMRGIEGGIPRDADVHLLVPSSPVHARCDRTAAPGAGGVRRRGWPIQDVHQAA